MTGNIDFKQLLHIIKIAEGQYTMYYPLILKASISGRNVTLVPLETMGFIREEVKNGRAWLITEPISMCFTRK